MQCGANTAVNERSFFRSKTYMLMKIFIFITAIIWGAIIIVAVAKRK